MSSSGAIKNEKFSAAAAFEQKAEKEQKLIKVASLSQIGRFFIVPQHDKNPPKNPSVIFEQKHQIFFVSYVIRYTWSK